MVDRIPRVHIDLSSRWYKAAGASIIAGTVTARYVAKWRRNRSLRRQSSERKTLGGRYYVGLDLTDPTIAKPRMCDVAILDPDLVCQFDQWEYNEQGNGIVPKAALGRSFILAIDGPQGLAGMETAPYRESERLTHTPGHTPFEMPENGKPYAGFTAGSVKLFYNLVTSGSRFRLVGMDNVASADANLLEVFPGAGWKALAGSARLSRKDSMAGRESRRQLLEMAGVAFTSEQPLTTDQLDAAMAAYTAFCFHQGVADLEGSAPWIDKECKVIREGYIVQPMVAATSEEEAEAFAPTG